MCLSGLLGHIHRFRQIVVWKGIQFGDSSPWITYMVFVDNIVVFGDASTRNVKYILDILKLFYNGSGQRINYSKPLLLVHKVFIANFATPSTDFHFSTLSWSLHIFGIYLWNLRCSFTFVPIVQKLEKKVGGWLNRPLSQAWRLIMIKSVLIVYPIYWMCFYKFPKKIIKLL